MYDPSVTAISELSSIASASQEKFPEIWILSHSHVWPQLWKIFQNEVAFNFSGGGGEDDCTPITANATCLMVQMCPFSTLGTSIRPLV
jgi:hypothetical protein